MIVDELRSREVEDRVERSARLRWTGGEFRLSVTVPPAFAAPADDASAFLAVALPLAMHRHEDVLIDGAVSPRLLRRTEILQAAYTAWNPGLRRCLVRVAAEEAVHERAPGVGSFLSRGVDSLYSAARPRHEPGPLTHLVFCDSLEPIQDDRVRAEERERCRAVADQLGLPLVLISTNLRDPRAQLVDYQDLHGAGLAFLGLSLSSGLGHLVIPSAADFSWIAPMGSSPVLDHLFSTESVDFEHDSIAEGRHGKVAWLARERPDLLGDLKVCFMANRADNCGECRKCLWTMVCLLAVGALEQADGFPDTIDVAALRRLRVADFPLRVFWMQAAQALPDGVAPEVKAALLHMMRRSARPTPRERARLAADYLRGRRERLDPNWSGSASLQFRNHTNVAVSLIRHGRPHPAAGVLPGRADAPRTEVGPIDAGPSARPDLAGLVRLLDAGGWRHLYAVDRIPPVPSVQRVGDLGALLREPAGGTVPVWLDPADRLSLSPAAVAAGPPSPVSVARWCLAPLGWQGTAGAGERMRLIARRAARGVALLRPPPAPSPVERPPVGHLHTEEGDGRIPLWAGTHPVTGDQLLTGNRWEAVDLGYGEPTLLGFLEPSAPVTGSLGTARPRLPWASRFGQRVRETDEGQPVAVRSTTA